MKPVAEPENLHRRKRVAGNRRSDKVVLASSVVAARCQFNNINQRILNDDTKNKELDSLKEQKTIVEKVSKNSVPMDSDMMDVTRLIDKTTEEENVSTEN